MARVITAKPQNPAPMTTQRARPVASVSLRPTVADAVQDAVLVVADQQRTVLGHGDAGQTRRLGLAAVDQEAGQEGFDGAGAAVLEPHARDLVAGRRLARPRAAERHEGVAVIGVREGAAGIEGHLHWRCVRRVASHRCLAHLGPGRSRDAAWRFVLRVHALFYAINIGPAVSLAGLHVVELLLLQFVA